MPRGTSSSDEQLPLNLELPTEEPAPPCAGDLVRAWCSEYARTHGGRQPDPSVVKRVAGVCRTIAKDRTDMDSWRDAWRACQAAGARGRYDVVAELAVPTATASYGRGNHYLAVVNSSVGASMPAVGWQP